MKTTTEITQEHRLFLQRNIETPLSVYLERANKKWYSEEEIINAIDKVLEIDDYEESLYNRLLKKELFGDEK